MDVDQYNAICGGLPHTTHVVQWGGAHVWKIGGKIFAVAGWSTNDGDFAVSFKCSDTSFDILKDQPGCRPAPYLASRGMTWIQCQTNETLSDDDLAAYLSESYRLVGVGLTKKLQAELGLDKQEIRT